MLYRPELDGLRGIAILAVLLFHCAPFSQYCPGGWIGVDLFFVLSGYLITTILAEEYESHGRIDWRRFYWRRILRLYPALIAFVLLVGFILPWILPAETWRHYFWAAGSTLFYVSNLVSVGMEPTDHTWSLAVEEQFYLVWPLVLTFLVLRFKRSTRLAIVTGFIVSALGARLILEYYGTTKWHLYTWPFTRADSLMCGAWVAFFGLRSSGVTPAFSKMLKVLAALSAIFLGYVFFQVNNYRFEMITLGLTVVSVTCAVLLLAMVTGHGCKWPLQFKILRWIGKRSYGIYLYHVPIFMLLASWPVGVKLAVLLFVAWLSYKYLEAPMLALKDRWAITRRS